MNVATGTISFLPYRPTPSADIFPVATPTLRSTASNAKPHYRFKKIALLDGDAGVSPQVGPSSKYTVPTKRGINRAMTKPTDEGGTSGDCPKAIRPTRRL